MIQCEISSLHYFTKCTSRNESHNFFFHFELNQDFCSQKNDSKQSKNWLTFRKYVLQFESARILQATSQVFNRIIFNFSLSDQCHSVDILKFLKKRKYPYPINPMFLNFFSVNMDF